MLEKLVAEIKDVLERIPSPFSYIHEKLAEGLAEAHAEIERLKERIEALEGGNKPVTMEELRAQANALREKIAEVSKKPEGEATVHSVDEHPDSPVPAPSERVSYPSPLPDHLAEADK